MGVGAANSQVAPPAPASTSANPECPVCGIADVRYAFMRNGYAVYRCAQCKLEFLCPQPEESVLSAIYGRNYFLGEPTPESAERTARLKRTTACLYLDAMAGALPQPGASILEVGCGTGDFLLQARQRGFQVQGIEYSAVSAETANRRLGAGTVRTGTLESIELPGESLDAIVACDVIEHVRDPKGFLRKAHACLRPGGLVFVVTPSLDSWSRQWMGRHWMEYKVEHLFYFGKTSLRLLLAGAGFEAPEFHKNRKAVSFDYVYHHFRTYSVPLLTPLISGVRRLLPGPALHHAWKIEGSGVMVMAHKPLSPENKQQP